MIGIGKYFGSAKMARIVQLSIMMGILGSFIAPLAFSTQGTVPTTNVHNILCGVVTTVSDVLSILALMMFILGGTLYAFAHVLPAAGNIRANLQGWGMGMLMGGIIALILYIIAPFIVDKLMGINQSQNVGNITSPVAATTGCTGNPV